MDSNEQFLATIKKLYNKRDLELREKFERSLPFQDAMFDRWERAKALGFADGSSIYNSSIIFGNVNVGSNSWIGPYTLIDGSGGGVEIGSFCSISSGVHIYTHDTVHWALSKGAAKKTIAPVKIYDCVYIGSQSVVAAGVTINEQSVVAANSFVNRDVPAKTIVGGSPAKPIGRVVGEGKNIKLVFE